MASVIKAMKNIFVSMDVQRGARHTTLSKWQEGCGVSIFSVAFFLWGLAYGLLDIMNYYIKVAMGIDRLSAAFLAMAYYFAYLVGAPIIGGPLVKRVGYRFALVVGFVLLATGMELMSVGASMLHFGMMCFSHFIVGLGVSTLERVANAYAVEVGPRKRACIRILIAQTWAGVGTIFAPVLANAVIFDPTKSTIVPARDPASSSRCLMPPPPAAGTEVIDLSRVVVFYRYLGFAVSALAVVFAVVFFRTSWVVEVDVPRSPALQCSKWKVWKHPLVSLKYSRLWFGVLANFFNLGCQVAVAQFFIEHMLVNTCASPKQGANDMMYAQIMFVVGRLVAALLVSLPLMLSSSLVSGLFKPRYILCSFLAGAVIFTGVGITASGTTAVACAILIMFFEAPSFPMIFESATAGFEEWTPTAETIIILSISGGGLLPMLMGLLSDHFGVSLGWSLVTACFGVTFMYTLSCNVIPSFGQAIDTAHEDGGSDKVERRSESSEQV